MHDCILSMTIKHLASMWIPFEYKHKNPMSNTVNSRVWAKETGECVSQATGYVKSWFKNLFLIELYPNSPHPGKKNNWVKGKWKIDTFCFHNFTELASSSRDKSTAIPPWLWWSGQYPCLWIHWCSISQPFYVGGHLELSTGGSFSLHSCCSELILWRWTANVLCLMGWGWWW